MTCCHHYYDQVEGGLNAFTVSMPRLTFGRGSLREAGQRACSWQMSKVALITDATLANSVHTEVVRQSLTAAGIDFAQYAETRIEPTDQSVLALCDFLNSADFDGVISVGGGSVIDTTKSALVYKHYPAPFTTYFGKPAGDGVAIPGPVLRHIACPTTCGTGSEMTGLSVIRLSALDTKFAMASPHIMPCEAIVDPDTLDTLPSSVMASSGFDAMSHAIECYTARAYSSWPKVDDPMARLQIQGANPWSDLGALEALKMVGKYLERGVADAGDVEARDKLMWGATLAGMAFGNCGTHLPHALSYGVSNLCKGYGAPQYPTDNGVFIPHGISVIVNSPSVFRWTAQAAPERHLQAARALGARVDDASLDDAGEVTAGRIIELMKATRVPNGLGGVGLSATDAGALADSAIRQGRAIANSPRDCSRDDIEGMYARAVAYW
jgi:hydroxyacid-oxoacid transhydrogenase